MNDIAVVGAGPVGLTLACILAASGQQVSVYEREKSKPAFSKAFALHARTLELFRDLDVADELISQGRAIRRMSLYSEAQRLGTVDFRHLESEFPFFISIPQYQLENILRERLLALGGDISWNKKIVAIEQASSDGIDVGVTVEDESGQYTHRHGYVIGCDGAHSAVRKLIDSKFSGDTYDSEFLVVDAHISWAGNKYEAHTFLSAKGYLMVMPFPGLKHRIVTDLQAGQFSSPPTLEQVHELLAEKGFKDIELYDAEWISNTRYHKRMADKFRVGRVFLAGDACHIHSPVGGQGLNTGIQDAFNLGWKLAAVISGDAPARLLDTYEQERRAIAQQVLDNTDAMTKRFADKNPLKIALRKWLLPMAFSSPKVQRKLAMNASGVAIGNPVSAATIPVTGKTVLKAGQRLPDVKINNGNYQQWLHRILPVNSYSVLLIAKKNVPEPVIETAAALSSHYLAHPKIVQLGGNLLLTSHKQAHDQWQIGQLEKFLDKELAIVIVRPDKYIAYVSESFDDTELTNIFNQLFNPISALQNHPSLVTLGISTQQQSSQKEASNEMVL